MSSFRTALGMVQPLSPRVQPQKVWKHLYSLREHWERLTGVDPAALYTEVQPLGCPPPGSAEELSAVSSDCAARLRRHHDAHYGPAYAIELARAETRWAPKLGSSDRQVARTPRGVIGVLQRPWHVRTAYRPLSEATTADYAEADFQAQADYVFQRYTGAAMSAWAEHIAAELLRRATCPPETVAEAWLLALAIGHGRLLAARAPTVAAALLAAEARWAETRPALVEALLAGIAPDHALARLKAALSEPEPEPLEEALFALEDLLAAAPVLGLQVGARAEDVRPLLTGLGDRGELRALAAARREAIGEPDTEPARLWPEVLLALSPPWMARWVASVGAARRSAQESLDRWLDDLVSTARAEPVPVMDGARRPWELRLDRAALSWPCRAFVVDAEHPDGYEVTAWLEAVEGALWQLEAPGQEALLIVLVSVAPIPGRDLAAVLEAAAQDPGIAARAARVSRPR